MEIFKIFHNLYLLSIITSHLDPADWFCLSCCDITLWSHYPDIIKHGDQQISKRFLELMTLKIEEKTRYVTGSVLYDDDDNHWIAVRTRTCNGTFIKKIDLQI